MNPLIQVDHLAKKYKTQTGYALQDVNLTVREGEIVGVLGPNGAGKSTLVKLLLGVIRPTAGTVRVLGVDPLRFRARDKRGIGVYLGGKSNLIYHLPVMDTARLFQSIYRIPRQTFDENLARYAEILRCEDFLNQRVATLSLGQRLRAELLCTLLYEPQLLILDEPTLGLDIEGKRVFRDVLHNLAAQQRLSVLITTHDVNDMQKLCSRILLVCKGKLEMDLSDDRFAQLLAQHVVLLTDGCLDPLPDGVRFIEDEGDCRRYLVPADRLEPVLRQVQAQPYRTIRQEQPSLEDLLYEYYR